MNPVLIVDDEPDLVAVLREALELSGYEVASASNGQEALDYLLSERIRPCLIFLDMTMPVMNGKAFLEHLHSGRYPSLVDIPVVVISALEQFLELRQFRCADIIRKPASLERILSMAGQYA